MTIVKPGWYVSKHDPLDVVFVTEEIFRAKYPTSYILCYKGLKLGEAPKRTVADWGFNDYYQPMNPEAHAHSLHQNALSALVLSEAIRLAERDLTPKSQKLRVETSAQKQKVPACIK